MKTFEDAIAALVAAEGGQELVDAVNGRLNKVNSEAKGLRERLHKTESKVNKIFELTGIDPAIEEDGLETALKGLKKNPNADTVITQLQKKISDLENRERIAIEKNQNSTKRTKLQEVFGELKVLDDWRGTLTDLLSLKVKFNGDDMVYVGDDGTEFPFVDGVKAYITKNPKLIANQQSGGAGSQPPTGGANNQLKMSRTDFEKLSDADKMDFSVKKGTLFD